MRTHALRKFQNRNLIRIADVYRKMLAGKHQAIDPFNQIGNVAEAACLLSVSVDRYRTAAERLVHKIRKCATVIETHARAVRVKDSDNARIEIMVTVITHR